VNLRWLSSALRDLDSGETKLYIGLIHHTDGTAGTLKRVEAFRRHYTGDFGVATECGWGRRKPETIPALMQIHREVAAAIRPGPGPREVTQ